MSANIVVAIPVIAPAFWHTIIMATSWSSSANSSLILLMFIGNMIMPTYYMIADIHAEIINNILYMPMEKLFSISFRS